MLVKTTLMASVLFAGLATTASAQTYYGPMGYGPYGYGSPYGPISYYRPYGAMGYYGAYGSAGYRPYGWMGSYAYQPTGTFQALWTSPSTASTPSAPPRTRRAASARQAYAASTQAYYGPMGYGPGWAATYAYQPTGTFQALWTTPSGPQPRAR